MLILYSLFVRLLQEREQNSPVASTSQQEDINKTPVQIKQTLPPQSKERQFRNQVITLRLRLKTRKDQLRREKLRSK